MTFQGLKFTNKRPFKDCLIHGLIRDKEGRKMSKSLGNGVDPMDVIDDYGCDSLRYFLATSTAPGMDLRYDTEKVKSTWNFINKLWNASRFCLMNMENFTKEDYKLENLKDIDKWIISKLNTTIKEVTNSMEKYEFNNVGSSLYSFIWNDFCDSYIELSKFSLDDNATLSTLHYVIENILKLLHPFMPFVTDEIYSMLPIHEENIILSSYPVYNNDFEFKCETSNVELMLDFIRQYRNIKAENNIDKTAVVKLNNDEDYSLIVKILKLNISKENLKINKYNVANSKYNVDIYFEKEETEADLIEKQKQIETLKNSISRREKLLSNEGYINKAPAKIVDEERKKLEEEKITLESLIK